MKNIGCTPATPRVPSKSLRRAPLTSVARLAISFDGRRQMKILRVISSTNPQGGGPIEGVKQLQSPLRDLGVDVEIVCCDAPDAPWLAASGLPTIHALGP